MLASVKTRRLAEEPAHEVVDHGRLSPPVRELDDAAPGRRNRGQGRPRELGRPVRAAVAPDRDAVVRGRGLARADSATRAPITVFFVGRRHDHLDARPGPRGSPGRRRAAAGRAPCARQPARQRRIYAGTTREEQRGRQRPELPRAPSWPFRCAPRELPRELPPDRAPSRTAPRRVRAPRRPARGPATGPPAARRRRREILGIVGEQNLGLVGTNPALPLRPTSRRRARRRRPTRESSAASRRPRRAARPPRRPGPVRARVPPFAEEAEVGSAARTRSARRSASQDLDARVRAQPPEVAARSGCGTSGRHPRSGATRGPRRRRRSLPARPRGETRTARRRRRSGRRAARPRRRGHAGPRRPFATRRRARTPADASSAPAVRRGAPASRRATARAPKWRARRCGARSRSRGCGNRSRRGRRAAAQRGDVVGVSHDPPRLLGGGRRRDAAFQPGRAIEPRGVRVRRRARLATRPPRRGGRRGAPGESTRPRRRAAARLLRTRARGSEERESPHPEVSGERRQEMVVADREAVPRRMRRARQNRIEKRLHRGGAARDAAR